MLSDILFGILSGTLSSGILFGIYSGILSGILFYLAFNLAVQVQQSPLDSGRPPAWSPAVPTGLGRPPVEVHRRPLDSRGPRLRSSSAHWYRKMVVQVQRRPLGSGVSILFVIFDIYCGILSTHVVFSLNTGLGFCNTIASFVSVKI